MCGRQVAGHRPAPDGHYGSVPDEDWGMAAMDGQTRADLLEIIDDRASHRATIITSQLPIEHWHEWIGDQTVADAMLDRLMQSHHRFTLEGESLRKKNPPAKTGTDA